VVKLLSANVRSETWLAICLAAIAGYVDSYAFKTYGVYVSFMSGNATATGSLLGQGVPSAVVPAVIAMLFFFVGAIAGSWLTHWKLVKPRRLIFATIAIPLAGVIGGSQMADGGLPADACIALLTLAMGLMNATHSESLSLTVMTGTLYRVGMHIGLGMRRAPLPGAQGPRDTHFYRARVDAKILAAFMAGAIAAGAASRYFGAWSLLPICLALLVLAFASNDVPLIATREFYRGARPGSFSP
jgi:uncharacterized membrane protein YoaK (UPF0700 family)